MSDQRFSNRGRPQQVGFPVDGSSVVTLPPGANIDPASNPTVQRAYVADVQKFANFSFLNNVTVAGVSSLAVSQPVERRTYFLVVNLDTVADLWVNFGAFAAIGRGVPIGPNRGSWELNNVIAQGDIYVFSVSAINYIIVQGSRADFGGD